ncbi:Ba195 [Baboon cytomegalovirus]|nr:Ba195 [Baboon cytomegalovirus]
MDAKTRSTLRWLPRTCLVIRIHGWLAVALAWSVVIYGIARFTFPDFYNFANCQACPLPVLLVIVPATLFFVVDFKADRFNNPGAWVYCVLLVSVSNAVFHTCTRDGIPVSMFCMSLLMFIIYTATGVVCARWARCLYVCYFLCIVVALTLVGVYAKTFIVTAVIYAILHIILQITIGAEMYYNLKLAPLIRTNSGSLLLYFLFIILYEMSIITWTSELRFSILKHLSSSSVNATATNSSG